jgi:hypothetical protein
MISNTGRRTTFIIHSKRALHSGAGADRTSDSLVEEQLMAAARNGGMRLQQTRKTFW